MKNVLKPIVISIAMVLSACSSLPSTDGGRWTGYTEVGEASFYADRHQGKKTASGEPYDRSRKTAAHRKLPFGTKLRVTNLDNDKSVVVTVNDRGPFSKKRVIDLSRSAFSRIADLSSGVVRVRIESID